MPDSNDDAVLDGPRTLSVPDASIRITYDDVAAAAAALADGGVQPSAARIRQRIGRGGLDTIQRHLVTWRERQARARLFTEEVWKAFQPAILARGRGLLEDLWPTIRQQLVGELEARLAAAEADANAVREENATIGQILTDLEKTIADLRHQVEVKAIEADQRQLELEAARNEVEVQAIERSGLERELASLRDLAEQRLADLSHHQRVAGEATAQLDASLVAQKALEERAVTAERAIAHADQARLSAETNAADLRDQLRRMEADRAQRAKDVDAQLAQERAAHALEITKLERANARLSATLEAKQAAEATLESIRQEIAQMRSRPDTPPAG